jgi:hypothetical protein
LREDKDVLVKKVVYSAFEFREDVLWVKKLNRV